MEHRIYCNNCFHVLAPLEECSTPKRLRKECISMANDYHAVSIGSTVWFCCDETGLAYHNVGSNPDFLISHKKGVKFGMTTDQHCKFFEKRINNVQILAQRNINNEWHGYVNFVHKKLFSTEQEAMQWVEDYKL